RRRSAGDGSLCGLDRGADAHGGAGLRVVAEVARGAPRPVGESRSTRDRGATVGLGIRFGIEIKRSISMRRDARASRAHHVACDTGDGDAGAVALLENVTTVRGRRVASRRGTAYTLHGGTKESEYARCTGACPVN